MDGFVRPVGLVLVAVLLSLVLGKQSKDMAAALSLAVCAGVCLAAAAFWEPVLALISSVRRLGNLDSEAVSILLKAAGIGLLSELASLICADAGEGAMARAVQLLGTAAVLWISLPLFQQLLTLIEEVLTGI